MKRDRDGDGDSNALELPARKKKFKAPKKNAGGKISKNMQRKLKKLQEEREMKEMREEAFETLKKHKLSENAQALIRSSSTLGKAETLREKLKRGMILKSVGLKLPGDIPLFRDRRISGESPDPESSATVQTKAKEKPVAMATPSGNEASWTIAPVIPCPQVLSPESDSPRAPDSEAPALAAGTSTAPVEMSRAPKYFVRVWRSEGVEESRSELPIVMMEQEIMEAVEENDAVIICGETGCGKTTQVPQFLYEAGYGSQECKDRCGTIGVTQPRRIAVLTTARRVAHELNLQLGKEVGFQVRHDRKLGEKSSIKFMTDGILLREIQTDFLLKNYSVIVLDEAHERSINTDILIGMLSRVLPLRNKLYRENKLVTPLKLIIMSATLRVEDFTGNSRMFPRPPPVIRVSARQFSVTIHSSRKTELADYESAAYRKVCAIHRKLPPGGILVFLTGRREVESLCRRLRISFSPSTSSRDPKPAPEEENQSQSLELEKLAEAADSGDEDSEAEQDEAGEEEDDDDETSESEASDVSDIEQTQAGAGTGGEKDDVKKPGPAYILPLYAMLPAAAQLRVFGEVPEGKRLIVVATNVAETSVTIPGIRYVVDCGRAKEKQLVSSSGVSRFQVSWISKASADQRAGRAGRTGPGHCYQLYSKTHYHHNFPEFAPPEITSVPIEGVVLLLKCMGIDKVINFPFPTPPEKEALRDAEKCLIALSALDPVSSSPTPLGKAMSVYPINPRHSRMLLAAMELAGGLKSSSKKSRIISSAAAIAAALSVESPLITLDQPEVESSKKNEEATGAPAATDSSAKGPNFFRKKLRNTSSDALTLLNILSAYECSDDKPGFCRSLRLNDKVMKEMSKLRVQLLRLVARQGIGYGDEQELQQAWEHLGEATSKLKRSEEKILIRGICCGWPDRVARRLTWREKLINAASKVHKRGARYQLASPDGELVYLSPSSSTSTISSEFVVYTEIVHTSRHYMLGVTSVDPLSLLTDAPHLCTFSKPLEDPPPFYDSGSDEVKCWVSASFGAHNWELPLHSLRLKPGKQRVAVFASALLQGKVLPGFLQLGGFLAADPVILLRPENFAHKRVAELVHRLENGPGGVVVDSRKLLAQAWGCDASFLFEEIAAWIQSKHQKLLQRLWEKLKLESQL